MSWPSLLAQRPDWVDGGKVRVLVQEAIKGHPDLDKLGVPLALDFAKSEEDRAVLRLVYTQEIFGRPYVLPPGVPADRVAAMRKAMEDTFKDPGFVADANRLSLGVTAPKTGAQIQALIAETYRTPPKIVARLRKLSLN